MTSDKRTRADAATEPAPGASTSKHAPKQWIYRNLTPYRIHASYNGRGETPCRQGVPGCQGEIVKVLSISALGEVVVPHEDASELNTLTMRRLGQLELRPAPSCFRSNLPRAVVIFGWLTVALVVTMWALLGGGGSSVQWRYCIAAAIVIPVVALSFATWREIRLYRRFGKYRKDNDGTTSLEGVQSGGRIQSFVDGTPRRMAELAVLVGALVVAVIGLGVAIHLTTQLNDLMPIDYGALVQLDNPFGGLRAIARSSPAFWQLLVGHIAQWVLVSIAAIVPAAMYFQFDRQRLAAVQRQWIRDVFRLDPTVRTVRDIQAKYGSQIEASFGDVDPDSGLRLGRGRRSPIVVATILLVVGWFLVISTTQVPALQTTALAGGGSQLRWPDAGPFPVSLFFWPHLTAVGYAFLGAYVFSVLHVIRGYQRRDLHPKTYNTIVVRILTAYALALVVSTVYDGTYAEVVMFFVGFMPQSALVWLREKVSSRGFKVIPLHEPAPLTELEGIDLYDRTRLAEEGVNNVEALAHADIIDLMSSTRISAAELVDWTDQAILYLKVGGDSLKQADETPAAEYAADARVNLCHLRSFGIRTATDLMRAYGAAVQRDGDATNNGQHGVDALVAALALPSPQQSTAVPPLQVIIDTMTAEEWFVQLRNWHQSEFAAADAWYHYLDGRDWELQEMDHGPTRGSSGLRSVPDRDDPAA